MVRFGALVFSLAMAGAATAEPVDESGRVALIGMTADLGTTALGLSLGAAEANPLGLAAVPLKFIVKSRIDQIRDQHERRQQLAQFTGVQFAAAAANLCTLAVAHPVAAALCFAGGMAFGYQRVRSIPTSEEECVKRHLPLFEAGAATGRSYTVELKTCTGRFAPARLAQSPDAPAELVAAPLAAARPS